MDIRPTPILECRDLSISFRTRRGLVPAVVEFNLTVMPGEAVGLVGESGCGKSTVALAIMRHLGQNGTITGGTIHFSGRDITTLRTEDLRAYRGSQMAMVYQEPMASLNPSMRAGDQLTEVLAVHEQISPRAAKDRTKALLTRVHLPDPERIMNAYPHQLSGGQQQRVLIAMALLSNPKLLLLDEPTTALDVTVEAGLIELIHEISAEFGTSMVYISHNLGLIRETCKKLTVMYSGHAVEHGTVDEVFRTMKHPYTRGLFNSIPLPWADRISRPLVPIRGQLPLPSERPAGCSFGPRCDFFVAGRCDATIEMAPISPNSGHLVRCVRRDEIDAEIKSVAIVQQEESTIGPPVLEVRNLQKYYWLGARSLLARLTGRSNSVVKANEKLDFTAHEGETVAIVGESGCGKSTFAKVLMGLETATSGEILINGREISRLPVQKRDAKLIESLQIVFQNPFETLNPSHSVGAQISRVIRKFKIATRSRDVEQKMFELLDLVKLPREFANRKPRHLSGGQKQRIGIARAFSGNARVVVADEPVSALDVSVQAAITGLLLDIQRKQRTTVIFISHDLSVVRYLADRVIVMYLGQIMEQGTVKQVFSPPYHPYTEALLSAVPIADTKIRKKRIILSGELPSPINPPTGCLFQTRCPRKIGAICEENAPPVQEFGSEHRILCHLGNDVFSAMEPVFAVQTE
jgi:peptide/nickel transport system ATP-binding protein